MGENNAMDRIHRLMDKGVTIPNPRDVFIDETVDLERISGQGVTLWPGSRISGADTLILPGASIGSQGPGTVDDCWFGPGAEIQSGYCSGAVLLAGARLGAGAHVRKGTILEEKASTAHTVGLKQTLLFPFVTLGSLINFCDVLMAGGTGPKNHSEVGSSYIHFNFTPNQDKATPSLLGDVPAGVMLDRPPIFLGGQGGLVGPCRLAYGTVIAAGAICRKDHLEPNRLVFEGGSRSFNVANKPGGYGNLGRVVANNIHYIANLVALDQWYTHVRSHFVTADLFPETLLTGLRQTLTAGITERIRQLDRFVDTLAESYGVTRDGTASVPAPALALVKGKAALLETLSDWIACPGETALRDQFLAGLEAATPIAGLDYIATISSLSADLKKLGTRWLQSVVDDVMARALDEIGAFQA